MRILVIWASKRGGTEGIGKEIAKELVRRGHEALALPVTKVHRASGFDAVIVGGALYAGLWPAAARRFVNRHVSELRRVPVWFFSSGPLDDSADAGDIPPTRSVAILAERAGAIGHVTFGGRLLPDARGFPASAMARKHAGDHRNFERVRAWADSVEAQLSTAVPGPFIDHPGRSVLRLVAYGALGWALCAAIMLGLQGLLGTAAALVIHAVAAPLVTVVLATRYFRVPGAREPLSTAFAWTAIVLLLDLVVVAGLILHSGAMFRSLAGTWLPLVLIFLAAWGTGATMATMPPRSASRRRPAHAT